jgi:hypothetical protein
MESKIKLKVVVAGQFGNERWFPDNPFSKMIAQLKSNDREVKTLKERDVLILMEAGYEITYSGAHSETLDKLGIKKK